MSEKIAKYEEIKRHIKEQIHNGDLQEGDRVPSEYELVELLGVGRGQTRQALRELELEGYLIRRQGAGSFVAPNAGQARGIVAEAPQTVAVAFPTYDTRYIREVVEGFMGRLFDEGYGVTNYNLQLDEEGEVRFLDSVGESGVAGLLIWLGNETDAVRESLLRVQEQRVPVVMVDRYFPDVELDYVVSDNVEIGYSLTKALIERGHTHIGVAVSDLDLATSQMNRVLGYQKALDEAGLSCDHFHRVVVDECNELLGASLNAVMAHRESPTAFMCVNDVISGYLGHKLHELGYNVPEHVELAVVDDGNRAEENGSTLLAVAQQGKEIGRQSAELMIARMKDYDRPAEHRCVAPSELRVFVPAEA